ncbi:MAG: DUF465 domain-containing protein [Pseudomonadota bacterium]
MALQGRIDELSVRHRKLDQLIETEQKRPSHDPTQLRDLKRQKLRIKEELRNLQTN